MARSNQEDEDVPKAKLTRENLKKTLWIFSYLGRYKMMFIPGIIAVLITAGMAMAFPILMGELIGEAMNSNSPEGREALLETVNRVAVILVIILSVQACITFGRMHLLGRAGDLAVADIRRDTYGKLVRLPMAFYNERRVGEISGHLAADLSLIRDTLCTTTPQFLRQCVMLLGGLTFLFILSPRLTFTMLLSLPVVLIAISLFGFRIRGRSKEAQDLLAETNVIVDETLHGIADVKAFANEAYETRRYEDGMKKYLKVAFELIGGRAMMVAMVIFALFGAITFVVWSGAHLLVEGQIARDSFTKFCFVTAFVGGAIAALPEIVSNIQKAVGATDRLRELFEETSEEDEENSGPVPESRATGKVEFKDVKFA
ncbi:MAG: ABC transporter transmembrane domain-containing protein, partial [Verrucomicrobiota bacterium]